jgi:hypothetical protein
MGALGHPGHYCDDILLWRFNLNLFFLFILKYLSWICLLVVWLVTFEIFRVLWYNKLSSWLLIYVTAVPQTHPVCSTLRTEIRVSVSRCISQGIVQTSSHAQFHFTRIFFRFRLTFSFISQGYSSDFDSRSVSFHKYIVQILSRVQFHSTRILFIFCLAVRFLLSVLCEKCTK